MAKRQEDRRILARERFDIDERTRGAQRRSGPVNATGGVPSYVANNPRWNSGQAWMSVSSSLGGIMNAFEKQQAKAERDAARAEDRAYRESLRAEAKAERAAEKAERLANTLDEMNGMAAASSMITDMLRKEQLGEFAAGPSAVHGWFNENLPQYGQDLGDTGRLALMRTVIGQHLGKAMQRVQMEEIADLRAGVETAVGSQSLNFYNNNFNDDYSLEATTAEFGKMRESLVGAGLSPLAADSTLYANALSNIRRIGENGGDVQQLYSMRDFLLNSSGLKVSLANNKTMAEDIEDTINAALDEARGRRNSAEAENTRRAEVGYKENYASLALEISGLSDADLDRKQVELETTGIDLRQDYGPVLASSIPQMFQNERIFRSGKIPPGNTAAVAEIEEGFRNASTDLIYGDRLQELSHMLSPKQMAEYLNRIDILRREGDASILSIRETHIGLLTPYFGENASVYKNVPLQRMDTLTNRVVPTETLIELRRMYNDALEPIKSSDFPNDPIGLRNARMEAANKVFDHIVSGKARNLLEVANMLPGGNAHLDAKAITKEEYDANPQKRAEARAVVFTPGSSLIERSKKIEEIRDEGVKNEFRTELRNGMIQAMQKREEALMRAEEVNLRMMLNIWDPNEVLPSGAQEILERGKEEIRIEFQKEYAEQLKSFGLSEGAQDMPFTKPEAPLEEIPESVIRPAPSYSPQLRVPEF